MSFFPLYSPNFSLSLFGSNTANGATISCPAGIIANDLMILMDRADSGFTSKVVPSGFTEIAETGDLDIKVVISYKIAAGTEGGTNLTGMSGSGDDAKLLYVFRPNFAAEYELLDVGEEVTTGNPASQTITCGSSTARRPLIAFGCYSVFNGTVESNTMTPSADGTITIINAAYLSYKIFNTSPENVTVDMGDEGDANVLQSFYFQLTE